VTERLHVPHAPADAFMRESLPLAEDEGGHLFRTFSPTRWSDGADPPPWPVSRWWAGWQHAANPRLRDLRPGEKVSMRIPQPDTNRRPRNPRKARRRGWTAT
jgi:hypothetical protein